MGLGRLYKAQKNKKNIVRGAKELASIEKLSDKTLEMIDSVIKNTDNSDLIQLLFEIKSMIAIDANAQDSLAVSNYMFGRLYRTHITSEYGIDKKNYQLEYLDSNELLQTENLTEILANTKEIISKNIKLARQLLEMTQTYAIANKDLLPRNSKEFNLYIDEYDNYIADKIKEIETQINELKNLNEDTNFDLNILKNIILNVSMSLAYSDDLNSYINNLFDFDLAVNAMLIKIRDFKSKNNIESSLIDKLESIITDYNKIIIMVTLNIFKVTKPFNNKYASHIENFDLEKIKKENFNNLVKLHSLISDAIKTL
ncbi:MAG: hypothetical protein ACRDDL_03150 [Sarcina sp.]